MEKLLRDTPFTIYQLTNRESVFGYPHIGLNPHAEKVINISDDHISIGTINENDQLFFDNDYKKTETVFLFDLSFLDEIVESYIGTKEYGLVVYFNRSKEVMLAYRTKDGKYHERNLFIHESSKAARQIVKVIHELIRRINL